MRNLLRDELTREEIARILSSAPKQPLLPPLGSKMWRSVAAIPAIQRWMEPMRALAAAEIESPMPELTDALYADFHATGARLPFENVYFERRRRFARAAMCALTDDGESRGKWLLSMQEKLEAILEETSWALPAHVNSPTGKDPMQIDLFAAETANMMAETLDLFGAVLPPALAEKICARLRTQIFENYLARHAEFHWTKATHNWNAVCHQGVIGAALAMEDDNDGIARMLTLARTYLTLFLRGFGSDGGCSEGPGYWQYGFGSFCALNEQLETRTQGELSLMEEDAHVRAIATYGPCVSLSNFHFVNFSDSPRTGALAPWLLMYLGRRFADEALLAHGYRGYQRLDQTGLNLHGQRTDLFYLVRLFLNYPTSHAEERGIEMQDCFFRDLGVLIARGRDERGHLWEFAAKAGHNAEHHNHNDCGSYLLNLNGAPAIIEIGAPVYTKDYFTERRYEYLAARTLGHSLPIVNGREQAAGPQFAAKVLSMEKAEDHAEFSVQLAPCYPADAHCLDLVRSFYFDKTRGRLRVKDFYELMIHESFETSIITESEPAIVGADGIARIPVRAGTLLVRPFGETVFAGIETHEYRDHGGAPRKVWRLILKPANLTEQNTVGYELALS